MTISSFREMWNKKDRLKKVCLCSIESRKIDERNIDYLGWAKCIVCNGYTDLRALLSSNSMGQPDC